MSSQRTICLRRHAAGSGGASLAGHPAPGATIAWRTKEPTSTGWAREVNLMSARPAPVMLVTVASGGHRRRGSSRPTGVQATSTMQPAACRGHNTLSAAVACTKLGYISDFSDSVLLLSPDDTPRLCTSGGLHAWATMRTLRTKDTIWTKGTGRKDHVRAPSLEQLRVAYTAAPDCKRSREVANSSRTRGATP